MFERKDRAAARAAANADLEADGEKALKTDDVTEKASVTLHLQYRALQLTQLVRSWLVLLEKRTMRFLRK